ncbi:hypothetical protein [Glaciecola sp. HTCC2999]|uniref:hypothetical protein n=1 Tax=Glaciecola sp. HTCC2999 TaxID=455436 RepID=UPI0000E0E5C8|nr:hypothetical protein [Glaciecola sp. HTCC2999]
MRLNPYEQDYEIANDKLKALSITLEDKKQKIHWYQRTDLNSLNLHYLELEGKLETQAKLIKRLKTNANEIESSSELLNKSIKSLWNPKNWFDIQQRRMRTELAEKKQLLNEISIKKTKQEGIFKRLKKRKEESLIEIADYKCFDIYTKSSEVAELANLLSKQLKDLEAIKEQKEKIDHKLQPVITQITSLEGKIIKLERRLIEAKNLDEDLSSASNSYERAMIHQDCEHKFHTSSPKRVIAKTSREITKLNRDLSKLNKRAKSIATKAARVVQKLIIDGNNLCYQGGSFIGFVALKPLIVSLVEQYKVVLVFDASIRRLLSMSDNEISNEIKGEIDLHVVATSIKADETVLDLAGSDSTSYIISNDRFAEFGEKSAIKQKRIIRHEIVSNKILIHDLEISMSF